MLGKNQKFHDLNVKAYNIEIKLCFWQTFWGNHDQEHIVFNIHL